MAKRAVAGQPVPKEALVFSSPMQFSATEPDNQTRQFTGEAYSGGIIENHWWWDRVIFNLDTTKSPQNIPALLNHRRDRIVGFAKKVDIGNNIMVEGAVLTASEAGREVASFADAGFPWQMSLHIEPSDILEIPEGFSKVVNGRNVDGPCFVFESSTIVEVSFTPTGQDPNTSAHVFNRGEETSAIHFSKMESNTMTPEEKAKMEALEAQVAQFTRDSEATAAALKAAEEREAAAKFSARCTRLKTAFSKIGMELTDAELEPYRNLDDDVFEIVAKKFESAKPVAQPNNAALFNQTFQPNGPAPVAGSNFDDNPVVKFSKKIAEGLKKNAVASGDAFMG